MKELQILVTRVDWNTVLPGFARCVRIVRDQKEIYKINPDLFIEPAEINLYKAYLAKLETSTASVDDLFAKIITLLPYINAFFDKVLVMTEDEKIRENRLGLLQSIAALANGIADLSKLEGF